MIKKRLKTLGLSREILKSPNRKKKHFCHHCETTGHTWPNCYKWLATQQSNSMIALGNQNQFPSSFAPIGDLLKAFMFLSNLNGFNSSPSPTDQGFTRWKGSSKVWKEKGSKCFYHFLLSPRVCVLHNLCVLLLFWVSLILCFALFNMFLFVVFSFFFSYKNN